MYDPNSLMYVTKEYENTLKEKAKKIYADDVVKTTLDQVNKELDNILLQINDRLDEISNKSSEINTYRADVHRFIDSTSVDPEKLVDSDISSTTSHPSVIANKQDRSEVNGFNYINFINQKIDLTSFVDINIKNGRLNSDDKVHSFDIQLSDKETLKVVEFSITYKQKPTIIHKITDSNITSEEDTVIINRVFTGRFYIIRPDVENNPDQIVVKMVVENSDNDPNNKDIRVLDVRSMKESNDIEYFDNIGPEFDLYFFVHSIDKLTVCIGNITPYKWVLKKSSYALGDCKEPDYLSIVSGNLNKHIVGIDHITNLNGYIIRDSDNKLYFSTDKNLTYDSLTEIKGIEYSGNSDKFWIKEIEGYVFIHSEDKTYLCMSSVDNIRDMDMDIHDIKNLSTGEIVASITGLGLVNFNKTTNLFELNPFVTTKGEKFDDSSNDLSIVKSGIDFVEIDNNKLLCFSTNEDNITYFFVPINQNTNIYGDFSYASEVVSKNVEDFALTDPTETELQCIVNATGIFVLLKVIGNNGIISRMYNLRDLTINSKSYTYSRFEKIQYFKHYTNEVYDENGNFYIKKLIKTSLGIFGIGHRTIESTITDELFKIDDTYAIKCVTTDEVKTEPDSEGNTTSLGYDDKNSYYKLDSNERIEGMYFKTKAPYLNDVVGVFETTTGVYVIDTHGVYELTLDRKIKTKYFTDYKISSYSRDPKIEKRSLIVINNENISDIYEMSDIIKQNTDNKLRYKYYNLFNGKYQKYNSEIISYDYDLENGNDNPLIRFNATLYISMVDLTGSIYNTYSSDSDIIKYSKTEYSFGDFDPISEHTIKFSIDVTQDDGNIVKKEISKTPNTVRFILRTNRYGFINYEGFNVENLNNTNISDVNGTKKYKIVKSSKDTDITLNDCRQQILKLMKNEFIDTNKSVGSKIYKYENTKVNEKYPVRAFATYNLDNAIIKIGKMLNSTYLIANDSKLLVCYGKILKQCKNEFVPTELDITATGFTNTEIGDFVWNDDGIMYYKGENTFTNQLTGYTKVEYGAINDVVYLNDVRQTIIIPCNNGTYSYSCRLKTGSTFSVPFTDSTRLSKISTSTLKSITINDIDGSIYAMEGSKVIKIEYDEDDSIVFKTMADLDTIWDKSDITSRFMFINNETNTLFVFGSRAGGSEDYYCKINLDSKEVTKIDDFDVDSASHHYAGIVSYIDSDDVIFISSYRGLYKIDKKTEEIVMISDYECGNFFKVKNRIYMTRKFDISWFDPKTYQFHEIPIPPFTSDNSLLTHTSDRSTVNVFYGDETGYIFYSPYWFNRNLIEIVDSEAVYKGFYENEETNLNVKNVIKNIGDDQYFVTEKYIYKNFNTTPITDSNIGFTTEKRTITTDVSPITGTEYYTIGGNFSRVFNLKAFDNNTEYYIRVGDPIYSEVDKNVITNPRRGTEYFVKNLDGKYESQGSRLKEFINVLTYYTAKYNYKKVNKSNGIISGQEYYVNSNPIYEKVSNIGTSFDSIIDYYGTLPVATNYTIYKRSFGISSGNIIVVVADSNDNEFGYAFDVNTKLKTALPFAPLDVFNTNIGTIIKYSKGNGQISFGILKDSLNELFVDIDDDVTNLDVLELKNTDPDTILTDFDEQDIYFVGTFGGIGKIYKYSPTTSDGWNKFHIVSTNNVGYNSIFNIDDDVYVIEKETNLSIVKYDRESKTFSNKYTGRQFELCNVVHKIDSHGKDDVYIVGNGDYNIYKSYNDTFKPVFINKNKNNFAPFAIFSDSKFIYCFEKMNNQCYVNIISNESDEKFELSIPIRKQNEVDMVEDLNWFIDDKKQTTIFASNFTFNDHTDFEGTISKPTCSNVYYYKTDVVKNVYDSELDCSKFIVNEDYRVDNEFGHCLSPEINLCPIPSYDNSNVIYTCHDNDLVKMQPAGKLQSLYNEDGSKILHLVPEFDMYIDSEYGTFGIQGNEVYLRKRYTEDNAKWKLINYLNVTGSSFKKILKTNTLGWILVDDRTVIKFNPETNKFDISITISDWTYDTVSDKVKINYIEEFVDSNTLVIGHIEHRETAWKGVAEPFGLQVYRNVGDKYEFRNITPINATNSTPCVGVYETRLGLFIVYLKFPTGTENIKISKSNFGSFTTYVAHLDDDYNATEVNFIGSAQTGYTWSGTSGNVLPLDLRQVFEDACGNIVLTRPMFRRDDTAANNNTNTQLRYFVLIKDTTNYVADNDKWDPNLWKFIPYCSKTTSKLTDLYNPTDIDFANYTSNTLNDGKLINGRSKTGINFYYRDFDSFDFKTNLTERRNTFYSLNNNILKNLSNFIPDNDGGIVMPYLNGIKLDVFSDDKFSFHSFCKYKFINGHHYLLASFITGNDLNSIVKNDPIQSFIAALYEIDVETNSIKQVTDTYIFGKSINVSRENLNKDGYNNIKPLDYSVSEDWDIFEFNGNIFVKCFGSVYSFGSKHLISITNEKPVFDNKVLYDLKLVIENKDLFNNLAEKTTNSYIDKFVVKESGIIDVDDPNSVYNEVDQFVEPHNYYNNNDGTQPDNSTTSSDEDQSLFIKEIETNNTIGNKLKNLYKPEENSALNNNRFIKKNNVLVDITGRHTNKLLGELENIINKLDTFKISLTIYPTNVVDSSNDKKTLIETI